MARRCLKNSQLIIIISPPPPGGAGGGAISLLANTLHINTTIRADGTDANATGSGGGSGGSIWITAGTLAGTAILTVNGGAGSGGAGGGSGGRIAVHATQGIAFEGTYEAMGGRSRGSPTGGPGTVFVELLDAPSLFQRVLRVDNNDTITASSFVNSFESSQGLIAWLSDLNADYAFDRVEIIRGAQLAVNARNNVSKPEIILRMNWEREYEE